MLEVGILLAAEDNHSFFSTHPVPFSHVLRGDSSSTLPLLHGASVSKEKGGGDPAWSVGAWAGLRART